MECPAPPWVIASVQRSLNAVHASQTAPFISIFQDHLKCLQQLRELQVRLAQLDKEGAELREENVLLHGKVSGLDDARSKVTAAEVEAAKASAAKLEREVSQLYKDKSRLLEELVGAGADLGAARKQAQALEGQLVQSQTRVSELQAQLASTSSALAHERAAREAAAAEVAAALAGRVQAQEEAERLRAENANLVRRFVELKEGEIERMNQINNLHEEALQQATMLRKEAAADKEAAEMIRARLMGMPLQAAAAAAAASAIAAEGAESEGGQVPAGQAAVVSAASLEAALMRITLKDAMGLPRLSSAQAGCQRVLPRAPYKSVLAHKGGCCSLASQVPGHLVASCGMNTAVLLWDASNLNAGLTAGPAESPGCSTGSYLPMSTLQGMTGGVNDVAFTCDGKQVLGAGTDKSLHLWDVASGHTRHTLTGHSAAVTGVASDPLDKGVAASCSEDRCIKVWDLSRGFCVRSLPCTKMPSCLLMVRDSNTIATGHVDGTVCLWDIRQGRGGGTGPVMEFKDHTQAICALSPAAGDGLLLIASRDNTLSLWDVRAMASTQVLRAPGFAVGTIGSMGRGHCRVDMSVDGRFVAAGATDGAVHVWDMGNSGTARTGGAATPKVLRHHKEAVVAAVWNNDVTALVTADKGGTLALWSLVE